MFERFFAWIDKARSRVYTIFGIWLAVAMSPVIFIAIFDDQSLIFEARHELKGEYIYNRFFNLTEPYGWLYPVCSILFATFMTWLVIWVFPKLFVTKAYRKEIQNGADRELVRIKRDQYISDEKKKLFQSEQDTAREEQKAVNEQMKASNTAEDQWSKEYDEFSQTRLINYLTSVNDVLQKEFGRFRYPDNAGRVVLNINSDLLAYMDSNDLVELDQDENTMELTKKGKYFMKRYIAEKERPRG